MHGKSASLVNSGLIVVAIENCWMQSLFIKTVHYFDKLLWQNLKNTLWHLQICNDYFTQESN